MVRTKQIDRRRTKKKKKIAENPTAAEDVHGDDETKQEPPPAAAPDSSSEDDEADSKPTAAAAAKKKRAGSKKKKKSGSLVLQRKKAETASAKKAGKASPAAKKKKATPKKSKPPLDEESFEDEEDEEESESSEQAEDSSEEYKEESESEEEESDEEDFMPAKKKKAPARRRPATRRKQELPSSSDEEFEEAPARKRGRPTRRAASRRRPVLSSSEEEEEDEFEETPPTRRSRTGRSRNTGSDSDLPGSGSRRLTPARASAAKANARLAMMEDDEDEEEEEEEEEVVKPKRKRRKKKDDDDEEFVEDTNEEEEDEDSDLDSDVEEGSINQKRLSVGNVDEEDFLDTDSSGGDERVGPSPTLEIRSSRGRTELLDEEAEESEAEASFSGVGEGQPRASQSSIPSMPDCPSTEDSVTMEKLPERHICYFAPDQQSCQCFCLDTLHRIAMSSNIRDDQGKRTFLQPPHFRTPMSDDLIDQIACRFGRNALDLMGDYYKRNLRRHKPSNGEEEELMDDAAFLRRLNNYISSCMGSRDVYCCPLCYTEAHHRLANLTSGEEESGVDDDDSTASGDDDANSQEISLWHDPMTVLGYLDNDMFQMAASFCFRKAVEVKRHLVSDHNIDPSILDGNGLFQRFKVRDGDGLLQRYIEKSFKGHTYQGDMQRYWLSGNSQSFVYLLHLMHRHESIKDKLEKLEDVPDEDRERVTKASDFFDSFANRARRTWKILSAPFTKVTKEDMKDFVVEGDVEEDEEPHFAFAFQQEMSPEEQIVEELRRKRQQRGEESDDEDEESEEDEEEVIHVDENEESGSGLDDSSNEPDALPPSYYSEEEDEDEWIASRRPGRKKVSPSSSGETRTPRQRSPGKRLRRGSNGSKKSAPMKTPRDQAATAAKPASSVRKLVIEESDSD